ncbi:MAG: STAS domain-containing protein [Planctomycetota bacterium]
MSEGDSRLRIDEQSGAVRVEFIDRNILEESNIQRIGDELLSIVADREQPRIVLNFRNVEHLSSAALGTLITVHNKVRARSGQLRLAEIDPQIMEVFAITKLDTLFEIHESDDAAFASLA